MLLSSRPTNSQLSNLRASVQLRQRRLTSTSCHWRSTILNASRQTTSISKRLGVGVGGGFHTGNMHRIKQRQQDQTRPLICDGWLVCGIWPFHPLGSFPPDHDLLHLKTALVPHCWLFRFRNNCDSFTETHLCQHLDWLFNHSSIFADRHFDKPTQGCVKLLK